MKLMKKIAPLIVSALFVGATAAAADLTSWKSSFPGVDTAVIVGAGSTAGLDSLGAVDIVSALTVTSTSTTSQPVANAHLIDAAGDELNIGETFWDVDSTLDDEDLPTLLMEGNYRDSKDTENDVTYTQEITFDATGVTNFATFDKNEESDKNADYYIYLDDGADAYTYELSFDQTVEYDTDHADADVLKEEFLMTKLSLLGRQYTITDAIDADDDDFIDGLTLMAGASQQTMNEYATETFVVKDKTFSVEVPVIADNEAETSVVLKVNGESTDELLEGDTYTLDDGTVLGIVDIMANEGTEDGGTDMVTFYLGAEKMELIDTDEIEMNGEAIDGSEVLFDTAAFELDGFTITFEPEDNIYLAKGESWIDPVIGRIKYTMQGLEQETETFEFTSSGNDGEMVLTNNAGRELVIPLVFDETNEEAYIGDELGSDEGLAWTLLGGVAPTAGDGGNWAMENLDAVTVADVEDLKGISFLAVSDGGEAHIITIDDVDSADTEITFEDVTKDKIYGPFTYTGGSDTFDLGYMDIDMTVALAASFDRINDYDANQLLFDTNKGAQVELTFDGTDTTFQILQNGDENAIDGTITFATDADITDPNMELAVSTTDLMCGASTSCELEDGSDYDVAVDADTADNLMSWGAYFKWNSEDNNEVTIVYPEEQTLVKAFVSEELTNIPELGMGGTSSGIAPVAVQDTDVNDVKTKNIIAVGGSAINRVSADLLSLPYPTYGTDAAWTAATGVDASGKAVVKLMNSPYTTGKFAMLVAGWEGVDTTRAAKALREGTPAMSGMMTKLNTATSTVTVISS